MEFVRTQTGDVVVVKLAGRLDGSNYHTAEESFADVLADEPPRMAIDLSELEYVSSAGLRVLLTVAKRVQQANGKVAVFGLNGGVRAVFSISGFDTVFSIQRDLEAAVAAVR